MGIMNRNTLLLSLALVGISVFAQDSDQAATPSLSKSEQLQYLEQKNADLEKKLGIQAGEIKGMGIAALASEYRATGNTDALNQLSQMAKDHEVSRLAITQNLPIDDNTVPILTDIMKLGENSAALKLSTIQPSHNLSPETLQNLESALKKVSADMSHNLAGSAADTLNRLDEKKVFVVAVASDIEPPALTEEPPSNWLHWGLAAAVAAGLGYFAFRRFRT